MTEIPVRRFSRMFGLVPFDKKFPLFVRNFLGVEIGERSQKFLYLYLKKHAISIENCTFFSIAWFGKQKIYLRFFSGCAKIAGSVDHS